MQTSLRLGLRRNPGFAARTTLHRAVVAEEAGRNFTVKVPIANPLSGWLKHLGMTSMVGEHGLIKGFPDNWMHFNVSSPSVRVDDVVPPDVPVCMLKADVEGYEPAVLRTAERLLSSGRVHAVQLEVTTSPDRRVASETVEALAHLEALGFTVRQLPRRMDNNASATFDSLPAFPSARAVPGCKNRAVRWRARRWRRRRSGAHTTATSTPSRRTWSRGTGSTTGATGVV